MKSIEPKYQLGSFTCPHCEATTGQKWGRIEKPAEVTIGYSVAMCQSHDCRKFSLWVGSLHEIENSGFWSFGDDVKLVWPRTRRGPEPNPDLDADIQKDFDEAREVLEVSPRAAAALLRLALQKLMKQLGQPGTNINDDIAALVKAGLRKDIQQALDVVRVVGNDAVHPGQIDTDDLDTVMALFGLVNIIAEDRISQPKRVQAIYDSMPEGKKQAIAKRDGKS